MLGIVFAIFAAVFIAVSQIVLRKSFKELKPSVAFFFDAAFGLLLWVPLALVMGVNFDVGLEEALFFAVISAILSEALVFFALSHGELAVTATIIATYPVYTVIISSVINDESLTFGLAFFIALAIIGSVWASSPDKFKKRELKIRKELVWPFVAALGMGFSDAISKGFINRSDDFSLLLMLGFVQVPVAIAYLRIEKQSLLASVRVAVNKFSQYKYSLLGGLFNIIGTGFLWLSFSYAPASIASPITGASGTLTVILGFYVFREKISFQKYLAIALTFAGIIGISVLNS